MDNTGKSKSLVDNQNTVTGITDSNNKTVTDVTNLDNNTIPINTNNASKKSDEECVKDKELVINEVLDEFLA